MKAEKSDSDGLCCLLMSRGERPEMSRKADRRGWWTQALSFVTGGHLIITAIVHQHSKKLGGGTGEKKDLGGLITPACHGLGGMGRGVCKKGKAGNALRVYS